MIDTRQEVLFALHEAAELEYGLMIQYLFAGITLKNETDASLSEKKWLAVSWRCNGMLPES